MGICSLAGSLAQLSMSLKPQGTNFYGPLVQADFFASGEEIPRKAESHIDVFGEEWQAANDHLKEAVATGRMTAEAARRQMEMKSCCAWISAHKGGQPMAYQFSVMLPQPTFKRFRSFSEKHLGSDMMFLISFNYANFADGRDGRSPSLSQFYEGTVLRVPDAEVDIIFRPGEVARSDMKLRGSSGIG